MMWVNCHGFCAMPEQVSPPAVPRVHAADGSGSAVLSRFSAQNESSAMWWPRAQPVTVFASASVKISGGPVSPPDP
jgi:hypothetical protein